MRLLLAAGTALVALPAAQPAGQSDPPEQEPAAVVWAVGDGADGSAPAKRLAALIEGERPDRFLYLGDVYDRGTESEFRRNFAGVYGGLAPITQPTPGNHEWGLRRQGYYPYWQGVKGRRQRPWYRFRLAGWEVLSLNSEAPHGPRSRQLRWLNDRLEGSEGDCRIAFWHRPRFSAGVYGDDHSYEPFWRALEGRARMVLSGHDHNMQRFRAERGIMQLVAGSGSTKRYPVHADPRVRFARDDRTGGLRLEFEPGLAQLEFTGVGGRVLDRSRVRCSP
jgi:hypothetical protein